jgi:hypothetical protein
VVPGSAAPQVTLIPPPAIAVGTTVRVRIACFNDLNQRFEGWYMHADYYGQGFYEKGALDTRGWVDVANAQLRRLQGRGRPNRHLQHRHPGRVSPFVVPSCNSTWALIRIMCDTVRRVDGLGSGWFTESVLAPCSPIVAQKAGPPFKPGDKVRVIDDEKLVQHIVSQTSLSWSTGVSAGCDSSPRCEYALWMDRGTFDDEELFCDSRFDPMTGFEHQSLGVTLLELMVRRVYVVAHQVPYTLPCCLRREARVPGQDRRSRQV